MDYHQDNTGTENGQIAHQKLMAVEAGNIGLWVIRGIEMTVWPGADIVKVIGKKEITFQLNNYEIERISKVEGNHHFKPAIEGLLNRKLCTIDMEIALPIDQKIIWVIIKGATVEGEKGAQMLTVAGSMTDCTARHHQDKLLRMSEAKYQHIFNQSNQAFCINTITPKGPGAFIEANPCALDLFGISLPLLVNLSFFDIFNPNSDEDLQYICKRVLNRQNIQINTRVKVISGGYIDVEVSSNTILLDGYYVILSVIKDITKLIATEQELLKARKRAEESERLKASFLENISHELRTPMNAIVGFSNLLSIDEIDKRTREEYVKIITNNTQLLLRLINDILDVSKIESGVLKILPKPVNLNLIISNLNDIFQNELVKLNKNHLKLIPVVPSDLDQISVVTDPIRISQILNNLLYNAIKFTDSGFVKFGLNIGTDNVLFFVQDTGIGILKEKQDVIFEHFRQANDTYAEKNHGGTGLGLSISKKLVELLGGKIWVESQRYIGSTFYFTIPYVPEMKQGDKMPGDGLALDKKTVLLVCDDEDEINLFSIYLFATTINFLTARTGEEALHILSSNPAIQLVIISQKLPDMDGLDAAVSYRSIRPDTKTVVFDSYFNETTRRSAMASDIKIINSFTTNESLFLRTLDELLS